MADWHPKQIAAPVEWLMQTQTQPFAVIRLITFTPVGSAAESWYRVVTWSPTSANRELVGWCKTLDAAAAAAWDYRAAESLWQHELMSRRTHDREGMPSKPPAGELLRAYRSARRAREAATSTSRPQAGTTAATGRPAPDRSAADRSAADRSAADRSAADRSAPDRSAAASPARGQREQPFPQTARPGRQLDERMPARR